MLKVQYSIFCSKKSLQSYHVCLYLLVIVMPPPGAYKTLSSFEMENRTALPKTNYYTFDKSATREQMNKTYNPLDNSPRGSESKQVPGPGTYQYKNMSMGTGGRHFSFLQKPKYAQGKQLTIKGKLSLSSTFISSISICKFFSIRSEQKTHCKFIHTLSDSTENFGTKSHLFDIEFIFSAIMRLIWHFIL